MINKHTNGLNNYSDYFMGNSCLIHGHNYVLVAKTRVFSKSWEFFWLGSTYSWQYEKCQCTKCGNEICYCNEGSSIDGPFIPGKIDPNRKLCKQTPDQIIAKMSEKYENVRWYTLDEINNIEKNK